MVDAKNAVLIADLVDYGGVHLNELYRIFARRGLGVSASTSPGSFSTAPLQNGWLSTVFAAFDTPATRYAPEPLSVVFSDNLMRRTYGQPMEPMELVEGRCATCPNDTRRAARTRSTTEMTPVPRQYSSRPRFSTQSLLSQTDQRRLAYG
jgi:hypothetical protein